MKSKFKECSNVQEILEFMQDPERFLHHTKYFHYTDEQVLGKILENKTLRFSWLGNEDKWNDGIEKKWYQDNVPDKNIFSLCFSTGTSESLPLWYLYSGIDGKGARLSFGKKEIEQLCKLEGGESSPQLPLSPGYISAMGRGLVDAGEMKLGGCWPSASGERSATFKSVLFKTSHGKPNI